MFSDIANSHNMSCFDGLISWEYYVFNAYPVDSQVGVGGGDLCFCAV